MRIQHHCVKSVEVRSVLNNTDPLNPFHTTDIDVISDDGNFEMILFSTSPEPVEVTTTAAVESLEFTREFLDHMKATDQLEMMLENIEKLSDIQDYLKHEMKAWIADNVFDAESEK